MHISTRQMTETEWLKTRHHGLGGSDVAAVLGLSNYRTALDVYNEKIQPEPAPREETPRMKAGKIMEATIARWWSKEYGYRIVRDNKIRIHPRYPYLLANLDRLILSASDNGRGTGILECKNTSSWAFKQWEDDGLPLDFYAQVQHYFSVSGHKWGAVAVLIDGWDLKAVDILPDKEFIQMMTDRLSDFWNDHVLKSVPPEPSTNEEVKKLYPDSKPLSEIQATVETLDLVKTAIENKKNLRNLEEVQENYETQIKAVMKENEQLTFGGNPIATWKKTKPSRQFDKDTFSLEHPDLLEKFTIEKDGYRRFKLIGE